MTKKNALLTLTGLLCLATLYAFSHPDSVREGVLTIFFPDRAPSVAVDRSSPNVERVDEQRIEGDTLPPLEERFDDFLNSDDPNMIDLKDPKAIEQQVEYDPESNMYIVTEKIGDEYYRAPTYMTFSEYLEWRDRKQQQEYFDRLQGVTTSGDRSRSGITDPIAKFDIKTSLVDRLFGGTNVDIRPQGNINLTFGFDYQKIQNPILTLRQQKTGNFDFDMDINMSASGKIGEKLDLNFNYNTQATFDFDNQMKLKYDTKSFGDDEILQNIEAGNVSMPLRSNLIKGAQNLFGIKTEMKFGHLRWTFLLAQQRSRQQSLNLQGGSQVQTYEKPIDEYDENRHFFLSQWNRNEFEPAMRCLPVPQSLFNITRMEVWITNDKLVTENVRDVVALMDLAEPHPFLDDTVPDCDDCPDYSLPVLPYQDIKGNGLPDNLNNRLYQDIKADVIASDGDFRFSDKIVNRLTTDYQLKQIRDFEKVRARLLSSSEYSYNEQLGFISVNLNVQPDQVVAVAVEYTYNGKPHKIGEFTSDVQSGDSLNQNVLFLKMLKSTTANVKFPIWDLMMKNVYAIGSANVDPNEFRFDIFYEDAGFGQKRFLNDPGMPTTIRSRPLLQVFGLDNLNLQADPGPDGIFDFVPGLTINLRSGRIMFPVLEPFGQYLADTLRHSPDPPPQSLIDKYAYPQLYDSTLFRAREFQQLNRFTLKGSYKSSTSSEISLGTFNLPQGSVRVSAGGRTLIEGQDYTVDYNIGKVKILNDAILQSGQNVSVSFEDNTLFGFQSRTMFGSRFDYELGKDINIGATFMNLFERPLTQKVNIGDDPINNKMYGVDFNISKDAPWLTKIVDKLPLISTKEPSSITAQAEFAALRPGHNKAINQGGDEGGTVYIDDFEGATANLPLANPANAWVIASLPQGVDTIFQEGSPTLDSALILARGANRAGITWYVPDPSARDAVDATNPYTRIIQYQDIFPNRQLTPLEQSNLRSFDVTIYPRDRGPYNYDLPETGYPGLSKGLTVEGELNEPKTRWAGIMRGLNTNDFEAANIEFVEFWMLNPYMDKADDPNNVSDGGDMYIDLGTLSEDIMRDSRQFFENALPTGQGTGTTAQTPWGRVPVLPPVVNAFDNDPDKRALQDLGLDGLNDEGELNYFTTWIAAIQSSGLSPNAKAEILLDPSNDDFTYYLDQKYQLTQPGLLARYRDFNNQQGNSPVNTTQNLNPSATNLPDAEDLNRDNSLNESEAYFRYKIPLTKGTVQVRTSGGNIVSMPGIDPNAPLLNVIITDTVVFQKEAGGPYYVWYRFKVPLDLQAREEVGGIQDFRSIRFIRMFFKEFSEQTTFRFATLELGRNQWRRFTQDILSCKPTDQPWSSTAFEVNAVSIEENSARTPFNYTIPYGIRREQSVGAFPDVLQNEQSLSMAVCNLQYCDARAVFKSLNMDLRQFKRLKMFVHAEEVDHTLYPLDSTDLTVFVRLGSDYVRNYYEYVLPLTPSNVDNLNGNPDSREYKDEVWRPENSFDFPLDLLTEVKKMRNAADGGNWPLDMVFEMPDPNNPRAKVRVLGNPNLGYVKGAMIGVRNVDETNNKANRHCVLTWFNEMRLNGFNEQPGWAGQARVDMKLADFGNISLAGIYTSIGWGSIEQKLIQRQREEVIQYDLSTNLELGKFLPERTGIKIPFYAQYSNITRNPEYDPYDLDIKLKDKLAAETDQTKRDSIRTVAQDITEVSGFNFTNVRKERRGAKKPMPWDISNFSFTYAFNQIKRRTPFVISDHYKQYKGGFDYQYSTGLKPFEPFKRSNLSDKWFKFIKEFNFNPVPNTYGFGTSLERITQATTWRFVGEDPKLNTYYNRRFTWDRDYDLGWDIARSLRFNFDAVARSLIDEPQQYKPDGNAYTDGERRDSIWSNIKNFGRPKNYMHNASLTWNVPLKFFPFLDWVSLKASYTAGYTWTAQSLKLQHLDAGPYEGFVNSRNLGNVIMNNNVRQINGDFDLTKLYDKSKYLAKINKPAKPGGSKSKNSDKNSAPATPGGAPSGGDPSGGNAPGAGGLGGMAPASKDQPANPRDAKRNSSDPSGGAPGAPGAPGSTDPSAKDKDKDKKDKKDKKEKNKDSQPSTAERVALRPLMLIRKVRFTYSETYGTIVPGFTPEPKFMGLSQGFDAPGWAFVAGVQPSVGWLDEAGAKGWITHRPELNQQVMRNYTQNMDGGITIEPFQDFRVELTATRQYVKNNTELFKDTLFNLDPEQVYFDHRAQRDLGSLTVSYFSLKTLFNNDINGLFARYQSYRPVISNRLAQNAAAIANSDPNIPDIDPNAPHDDSDDASAYKKGYGRTQQEVLLPAFIAAYTESDPNKVGLDVFKTMPAPNWRLTYNGLSKIGKLSKTFSSIQISHGYKSTLTVNSYNTDIFYEPESPYFEDELSFNYIARYEIPQVFINEQMAPLFGMDVKMKNDMTFKFDFKKSRTLAMSFIDYQLAETNSSGYSVGFGYRMKNVQIGFLTGKKAKKSKSKKSTTKPGSTTPPAPGGSGQQANDMNFKFDFEVRDDITVNHRLDQLDEAVPTRGARTISVNPSVEYALNKRLSLRLFTDYRKTVPKTSQSFPITTVNAGVTVQFKLN